MAEDYEGMTVAELKVLLREQGLPVSGKKSELIERLSNAQDVESPEPEEVEASEAEETVEEAADEDDFVDDSDDDWDDDWDDEEDEGHVAKQKPVLSEDMKLALALRSEQKKKTPAFKRTEWFRYKRLSRSGWRAPHGMDSKQRRNYKYRSSLVRVGHGKVAAARGLHPSGFREVMVHNTLDLEEIDPETQAARVGKTVGGRKREQIYSRADELGIRVLNRRRDV
ncbi:MAG TPA: 50S ribosomal protein L32e [Candidatus Poseidoniaceae archaeon]|nr:MAG TPA: 50S ribosomal protein L32e [Candidatus Poseidoniales archaeon]DAC60639.1 MAG TPA: 50S ribosomal protein L32e [Candidatus Poseidoniales archaeon]HII23074.1 50S ribosomal protein L32e [Candidatus Poseidoniaceae archaeon]HII50079.1 50S ribosomal protein L32e [Candidatus Poseidoniaceae archaeon]|tara:strand:- start:5219 stop:5893 length:675 start_codon:yes stop_codon:yes gene_type:complete